MKSSRRQISLIAVLLMFVNSFALAQSPIAIDENAAASIPGVRVKTELVLQGTLSPETFSSPGSSAALPDGYARPLYQQVDPCRMISTRIADQIAEPYGPKPSVGNGGPVAQHQAFSANEFRSYSVTGLLPDTGLSTSTNPCSNVVPGDAIGLAVRVGVHNPSSDGRILLFPGNPGGSFPEPSRPALAFGGRPNQAASFQEDVATLIGKGTLLLPDNGALSIKASFSGNQRLDLTVDLLGYFLADETEGSQGPAGLDGQDGQDGTGISSVLAITGIPGSNAIAAFDAATETLTLTIPAGEQGPAGADGAQGPTGLTGADGAQGPTGLTGADGAQGPTGLTGADGATGVQGEVGPTGPQGIPGQDGEDGNNGGVIAAGISTCGPSSDQGRRTVSAPGMTAADVVLITYSDPAGDSSGANYKSAVVTSRTTDQFTVRCEAGVIFAYFVVQAQNN